MSYNKLFKNWKKDFLTEARIDKVKAKYKDRHSTIDNLSDGDPSGNDAYLGWMAKQAIERNHSVPDVVAVTRAFHANKQRLDKKDIYQWKFEDLKSKIETLGASKTKEKQSVKDSTIKIYEDDDYLLIAPLDTGASCLYGANTRWCISAHDDNQFKTYSREHEVSFVFVINKKAEPSSKFSKIALVYYSEGHIRKLASKLHTKPGYQMPLYQIVTMLMSNPQEVYDAADDLTCRISLPNEIWRDLDPNDIPDQLLGPARGGPCQEKLDQILNGQWTAKFQELVFNALGKIRTGIEDAIEKENEKVRHMVDHITNAVLSSGELFRHFKMEWGQYKRIQHRNTRDGIDIIEDSEILQDANVNTRQKDIALQAGKAKLIMTFKDLGIKPVIYEGKERRRLAAELNEFYNHVDAGDWLVAVHEISKSTDPRAEGLAEKIVDNIIEDKFTLERQSRTANILKRVITKYVPYESVSDFSNYHPMAPYINVEKEELGIHVTFEANYADSYYRTFMAVSEFEKKLPDFGEDLRHALLNSEPVEGVKMINPSRKHWFWEPI